MLCVVCLQMPALKIPSSPGNFNPPPMEPAGPPTAAGGVCVLRLPAVNSLSELLRYLCTRAGVQNLMCNVSLGMELTGMNHFK